MITYEIFRQKDIDLIAPMYASYFNLYEDASWTVDTAKRRLKQLLFREDSVSLIQFKNNEISGFSVGQLVQFDDGLVFELIEIIVFKEFQGQELGSQLLMAIEEQAKLLGAFRIQLFAADDDLHNHFYNVKHSYKNATNNLWKTKTL